MKNNKWFKLIRKRRGAVSVIAAFSIIFILIIAAFVIDFGLSYLKTAHMQNSADSASLAAASLLPVSYNDTYGIQDVNQKALEYLEKNDITEEDYTINVQLNLGANNLYSSVTVDIDKHERLYIAPVIGVTHLDVSREATAQISPAIGIGNVVPLSITKELMDYAKATGQTQHLELKLGASDIDVLFGAFGALDLDGTAGGGSSLYSEWLENGFQGILYVGQQLPVEPGNMSNPTMAAFTERYDSCTHFPSSGGCTIDHYVETCPRVVIVPVITYIDSHEIVIEGFCAFIIEDCAGQGVNSIITGSFVRDIIVNGQGSIDDVLGGSNDFGLYAITLID
ncbi:MAG: hypothetical protein HN389_07705 [Clostridia bacterium]|jgi:Flp pilus assembly protein TadG|nr:hypothetical protein [Clostridia bacterium]